MPKKSVSLAKKSNSDVRPRGAKANTGQSRRLTMPKRIWYKPLTWRYGAPVPVRRPLPKARHILSASVRLLWANKTLFVGIALTYGVLSAIFVHGLTGSNNALQTKNELDNILGGFNGKLTTSFITFMGLLGSADSSGNATSGVYQSILLVTCSLAIVWALRQVLAKHKVRIRDSFYLGMSPLVPFLLICLLMGVQLLPATLGGGLYSALINYGIAQNLAEKGTALVIFAALIFWSLRMLTASLFALYIVTLPGMTPLRAYRNARELVNGRRLLIWRKLILLPVVLVLVAFVVLLPVLLFVPPAAVWVFFALSMLALPVAHTYVYNLYRDLL